MQEAKPLKPLSCRLMEAAEAACHAVCDAEEAAAHYQESFGRWYSWCCWWDGFLTSWNGEGDDSALINIARNLAYRWGDVLLNPLLPYARTVQLTNFKTYMFQLVKKATGESEIVPVWAESETEANSIIRQFYSERYHIGNFVTYPRRYYGGVYTQVF